MFQQMALSTSRTTATKTNEPNMTPVSFALKVDEGCVLCSEKYGKRAFKLIETQATTEHEPRLKAPGQCWCSLFFTHLKI